MHASRVSTSADPEWGIQINSIVSPFSMSLGDHVSGGLVQLILKQHSNVNFGQGHALGASGRPISVVWDDHFYGILWTFPFLKGVDGICHV